MEENFPRGKVQKKSVSKLKSETPGHRKQGHRPVDSNDVLFKDAEIGPEKKKKTRKRKSGKAEDKGSKKQKREDEDSSALLSTKDIIKHLSIKTLTDETLLLGAIREIHDIELVISLPSNLHGYVQITDINDKYTERLREEQQKEANDEETVDDDDEQQELPTLHEAFSIGDLVICRVKELSVAKGQSRILLTLNPADLTANLSADNLKESMVLPGSVASVEDHGFMVDVGISGIKAFLQTKDANQYIHNQNQGKTLFIGQLLQCVIKETKSNGRSLIITIDRKAIRKSQAQHDTHTTLPSFLPGTRVEASITYVGATYLAAVVHSTFKASIMEFHLTDFMQSTSDFKVSEKVSACVLFNCPVSKTLGLSLKPEYSDPTAKLKKSFFGGLAIGDFADKAKVRRINQKRGLLVDIKKDVQGWVMTSQVGDKRITNLEETFTEGQVIKCRITDFNFIDNLALVSMKSAILNERYLDLKDVTPGDRVKGTITAIQDNGLQVKISAHVKGFVPRIHLADVPIQNPHKIFSEADKIALRVIHVSPHQNRLILTHKKTLVKSKLNIISDYSQFEEDVYVHGSVVAVRKFGCLVMFCNGVKGLIPRSELANEPIEFPEKIFYVGQVVKCRVIKTHEPSMKRVILSLKSEESKLKRTEKKRTTEPKVAVGKIMKVTVESVTANGLDVKMETGEEAIIPTMHLSDYVMNCDLILAAARPGDEMEAMMFNNKGPKGQQILTCKPSLVGVSKSGDMLNDFSELEAGMEMVGCLRNIMPYGLFVEFLNNLVGLAPLKDISDSYTLDPSKLFTIGQTLHARVKEVNEEKKRFLVTLKPSEVSVDVKALDLLQGFLKEQATTLKKLKSAGKHKVLSGMAVGDIVTASIKEIQKGGFLCQLDGNISAVITRGHCPAKHGHQPGDEIQAVILHLDVPSEVVELSMKQNLVAFTQTLQKKVLKLEELKVKVELVKEYFVVASTDEGALVFLPGKKHYNDVRTGATLLKFGQACKVKVHGIVAGKTIAEVLQESDCDSDNDSRNFIRFSPKEMEEKAEEHSVTRGNIVEAVIHSVKEGQVNVVVKDRIQGRIHVTEIVDDATHGKSVLNGFRSKQKLKARVIGYREMKQNKSLIITNQFTQLGLELSIKPSKMEDEYEVPEKHLSAKKQLHSFQPGQTVTVFTQQFSSNILWVHITPNVGGKIHRLNISKKLSVLAEPERHFKKSGQAIQAKVLGLDDEEKVLQLSMTGEDKREIKEKTIVNGCVKKVLTDRLCIQLAFGCFGSVFITDIRDHFKQHPLECFKEDQYVRCAVLDAKDSQHVVLSLRPSRISKHNDPGADQEIMTLDDVKEGSVVKGYVSECNDLALFVCLSRTVTGTVKLKQVSEYYVEDFSSVFPVGKLVSVKVLRVNKGKEKVLLSMLPKDTELPDAVPEHLRGHFKVSKKESRKRRRKSSEKRESDDSGMEESASEDEMGAAAPRLTLSSGFSWDVDLSKLGQMTKLGAAAADGDDDDESSSEEDDDAPPQKKTKKEKVKDKKSEEAEIQRTEQALMQEDRTPETVDDFNRLVLSSPNSSMVWIRFMAFHLQNSEAEKARAVGERALDTINFREEQEKLNVWVAYLNLENLYGTEETLVKVFERALQQCEPIKVFQQLISIYIRTDKNEAADQIFNTMVKRFRSEKDVWINYGSFLMRNGKQDAAHKLMQRSFKSLESKQHVDVIVKFAQMEFKFGEPERGKTMFDNVLSSYSKRTDIWSVYLDMVIKQDHPSNTRNLFERVVGLNLQPKKIKFFFKRYLDYEKKFGDESRVKAVKAKAVEYVQKKSSVPT